jgi:hypothetical protein
MGYESTDYVSILMRILMLIEDFYVGGQILT